MTNQTSITVDEYAALDEPEGSRYELSRGELIATPPSSPRHNKIRDRLCARLLTFPGIELLGDVYTETDVTLARDVVRRPDVSFIRADRIEGIDLDQVPMFVAPDLVIEIVSRNDRADDLMVKVSQYLEAGATAVWVMYPMTGLAYRYVPGKLEPQVRSALAGDVFDEPALLPGFSLRLREILG
jgi:Uma2 family endonuclease